MSGDYSKEVTPVPMPNTEVKLLSVDGSRTYVPLEQNVARQKVDAMSRIETARSLFLCLKRQNKSKHKERWLGEVKTFESDETRNVKYNKKQS